MLPRFDYVRAKSAQDAVRRLSSASSRVHAGGTDLLGCMRDGVVQATRLVSLSDAKELGGIERTAEGGLRIGAMVTVAKIARDELVRARYPGLAEAASEIASPQLRNQGTLGGNLCQRPRCWYFRGEFDCAKKGGAFCFAVDGESRYHAIFGGGRCHIVHPSDTAPMLVALDAVARVAGPQGARAVRLEEFFVLPDRHMEKENVLEQGELVTDVLLPPPRAGHISSYRKVRERQSWDFALVSVALSVRRDGGRVGDARVVLGGVAPAPWRSKGTEDAIRGKRIDAAVAARAAEAATRGATPLGQNGYKLALLRGAVEESLLALR